MKGRKLIAWILVFLMVISLMPSSIQAEAKTKAAKLSNKKISITVGSSKKIKLLNNTKKVKWTTSNKKVVKITKKNKKYVKVKALKAGSAKITAKVGKKKYVCKVTVRAKKNSTEATTLNSETPLEPTTEATTLTTESTVASTTEVTEIPTTTSEDKKDEPVEKYSRLKWIGALLESVGIETITDEQVSKDPNGNSLYSYVDIKEANSKLLVETAVCEEILVPAEGQEDVFFFYPEQSITREFAAVTAVRALGYVESKDALVCNDSESLNYPLWDAAAVNIGLIGLQDGNFNGEEELSGREAQQILEKVKEIKAADTEIPENVVDIKYTENVVKDSVCDMTDYLVTETETGYQITVNNYTGNIEETELEAGKTVFLPADTYGEYPDGFVCHITEVEALKQQLIITGTPVESVFEVIDSLQLSGNTIADKIILADGVIMKSAESDEIIEAPLDRASDGLTEEQINSKLGEISGAVELPGGTFSLEKSLGEYGKVGINLDSPQITYDIKCNKTELKRFKVVVSNVGTVNLNANLGVGSEAPELRCDMFTIPVKLGGGFEVSLLFSLQVSVSGSASLQCSFTTNMGVDLQKENKFIRNFNMDASQCYEVSASLGPEIDIVLDWLDDKLLKIADLNIGFGVKYESKTSLEKNAEGKDLYCMDNSSSSYITLGVGNVKDSLLNKIGLSFSNSFTPKVFTDAHCETLDVTGVFKRVSECTAVKNLYGAVLDKYGNNVKFDNIIIRSKTDPEQEFRADNSKAGAYECKVPNGSYEIIAVWDGVIKVREDVMVSGNTNYDIREAGVLDGGVGGGYTWSINKDGNFECEVDESADISEIKEVIEKYRSNIRSVYMFGTVGEQSFNGLFAECGGLVSVNLEKLNTKNVTNMGAMFYKCKQLENIELGSFDTSNVTDMRYMFYHCDKLGSVDLSSFDTSSVTNMRYMFSGCKSSLTELDLSSFDTSSVTYVEHMFDNCISLTKLDLSNFDTSNVTNMEGMFMYCWKLEKLNITGFDTSNVTNMKSMFCDCRALTELDLSSFNTSSVIQFNSMFSSCSKLTELDLSNFDTSNVRNMCSMFSGCNKLRELNLSSFDTSNVRDMSNMFLFCRSLAELDLSSFDTSNVTNMKGMFCMDLSVLMDYGEEVSQLTVLDLSNFNTSSVTDMRGMFEHCCNLTELDLSSFDVSNAKTKEMFKGCKDEIIPDWYEN